MPGQLTIDDSGKSLRLPAQGTTTIGRTAGSGFEVDDTLVSRTHCQIESDGEFFWLTDLNSKGGTLLNETPIQKALLYDGDEILIGKTLIVFSLIDAPVEPPPSAPLAEDAQRPTHVISAKKLVGQTFGGCKMERRLDKRGTASVFEASQLSMHRRVAVKILPPTEEAVAPEERQTAIDRFLRGARSAGRLNHTNIVTIYDVGLVQDLAYVVMEFVDGTDLRSVVDSRVKKGAPLNLYTSLTIASHIARGLDHAYHKRIVHRNIKPRNILVDREGTAKLAGFGLARSLDDERVAGSGAGPASSDVRDYLAPEQRRPDGAIDHRSDIYSLGAVLYHMLTNRSPTEGASGDGDLEGIVDQAITWPEGSDSVPSFVREICEKAMSADPEGRYATPDEFQDALRAARDKVKNGGVED